MQPSKILAAISFHITNKGKQLPQRTMNLRLNNLSCCEAEKEVRKQYNAFQQTMGLARTYSVQILSVQPC